MSSRKVAVAELLTILAMIIAGVAAFANLSGRVDILRPSLESESAEARAALKEVEEKLEQIDKRLEDALEAIEKSKVAAQEKILADRLPVGTIVASILKPSAFTSIHADWVLCDGQAVAGTELLSLGQERVPDLRAMFLRGANAGRTDSYQDPSGDRPAGQIQDDFFASHHHDANIFKRKMSSSKGGTWIWTDHGSQSGPHKSSTDKGGPETRPNNAAVYFYCRIN